MFYATGDIHSDHIGFRARVRDLDLTEEDVLLCMGDVGLKYGWDENSYLLRIMSNLPCRVLVYRGNHDARYCRELESGTYGLVMDYLDESNSSLNRKAKREDWNGIEILVDTKFPNIGYLPDGGGLFTMNGLNCLVAPGAFSVDREFRQELGYPYEPDEQLTREEMSALADLAKGNRIDYVFSHTAPLAWEPDFVDLFLPGMDQSKVDKTMERFFDEILDQVKEACRGWYFGHFHANRSVGGGIGHMLFQDVIAIEDLA